MSDDSQPDNIVSNPRPWVKLQDKLSVWLKAYLDDTNPATFLNKTGSARAAKYNCSTPQSFSNVGSQNYIKLQDRIELWLDDHGLTKERNKKKLLQLSEAQETKVITIEGKVAPESLPDNFTIVTESVQEKYSKSGGRYEQIKTVISYTLTANETQRRTTDMMIKVLGQYAVEKIDVSLDNKLLQLMSQGRKRAQEADDE
ncbi:MAG: hypothetical protein KAV87_02430 [Desulfobacteraceae bacterium]|nr:hypothetical protein [Desulfobacteraceae bacterium]